MKQVILLVLAFTSMLLQFCAVQNHATTVERDKENGCTLHVILQIGIDGTDSDVIAVRDQLEECYSKKCFIPCSNDSSAGCEVLSHVIVKKWSSLSGDDKKNFHHITMVNNDNLPSNASIGTPNGGPGVGTWRRGAYPRTYCHEALHLAGLKDQYCSRIYDTVTNTVKNEISCTPPPDPDGGSCCTPTADWRRCSSPCRDHDHDLMATLDPDLSCQNIIDVVKNAGFNSCPEECCKKPVHRISYKQPVNLIYLGPSYVHFGDKDLHYGSFGITGGGTHFFTPKIGATLDVGIYFHSETQSGIKESYNQLNITGGITYLPPLTLSKQSTGPILSTHALIGISSLTNKYSSGSFKGKNSDNSFNLNIGAALDWPINKMWNIRAPMIDYIPTFFSKSTQNNYRVSVAAVLNLR